MSRNGDDSSLLLKDESFTKFDRLLHRAEGEGRIDGPFSCPICGMHYLTNGESVDCCSLATESPAPIPGPILGSVSRNRARAKKPAVNQKLKVADGALDIVFTPDRAMLEALDTLNLNELFPEETITRNTENDRVLLVCLFSMFLEEADGDRKSAFQIAKQNGLKMHPTKWGKMVFRLVQLGVLAFYTSHEDHPDVEVGNFPRSGEADDSEKATKE
ncbi:MAG: hypothetical protein WC693_03105 [Patescibacteria group bacterium]|jgi:hypothetical protein